VLKVREAAAERPRGGRDPGRHPGPEAAPGQHAGRRDAPRPGEELRLVEAPSTTATDEIPFNFAGFKGCLKLGDRVLLADAAVEVVALRFEGDAVIARVRRGRGDRRPQGRATCPIRTSPRNCRPPDRGHITLAQSWASTCSACVRLCAPRAQPLRETRAKMLLVAKIERRTALDNLKGSSSGRRPDGRARRPRSRSAARTAALVQKTLIQEALRAGIRDHGERDARVDGLGLAPDARRVTDVANAVLDAPTP